MQRTAFLAVVAAVACVAGLASSLAIPRPTADNREVRVDYLDGIGSLNSTNVYSGFANVSSVYDSSLYYLFFESRSATPATDPVVVWFQGGPGCSSLFGLFIENGPYMILENETFVFNPYSWNNNAHVLWIDQPVGTGYSYTNSPLGYDVNEAEIARQAYITLTTFFQRHPEYAKQKLFLFGESYGGHYVPHIANYILQQTNTLNLAGIGIGNGWLSPYYQTGQNAKFLYEHGRITALERDAYDDSYVLYKALLDAKLYVPATVVGNAMLEALTLEGGIGDVYDINEKSDPTTPLNKALTKYLDSESVKQKLQATQHKWVGCNNLPHLALIDDSERSSLKLLPGILAKIRVLLYNGGNDLICNYLGTAAYAAEINWPFQDQFNNAVNTTWYVDGVAAGWYKSASSLTKLVVNDASHMVPYSQPKNALAMLTSFINNTPY
ncbi:hypothetical protein CAOG_00464 [Capsaspora owczarzaki ATCC 30864]|uniref:Carboxypeptidase n=1 Tax=Capsaspora owczarzaki (strain ATCC 30864) TaxID=595528 RepID=A0A0D2WH60_CAPO3|nr:hypothetical protein CAOG_00464 [Capsaspora owczarzaki ATCC 30864]KJE88890.1 hypothetical protein CAOG_000464 [Capsaspora owczarzaki ATCC 30864]|eukprot:XP_004365335.1 hypothetical protein CAOG_00464 [Capsaspora owczarzaki ATCC 30864]